MEDLEETIRLSGALERQNRRSKERSYARMSNSLRGAMTLSKMESRMAGREPFYQAMEQANETMAKRIEAFKASSLPASTYIK